MGFFDFFKKVKTPQEAAETIDFAEIPAWIDKKKESITMSHRKPKQEISNILLKTLQELEDGAEILKNLDLTEKKAQEREKLMVKQNLCNFADYLKELILELKQLDLTINPDSISLETAINKIISAFSNFEKRSIVSFQKSTYLIGEELGRVLETISNFFKSFNRIVKENNSSIEQLKIISIIEEKLKQIQDLEKMLFENEKAILEIQEKIKSFEQEIKKSENKIDKIKKTQEYADQIKNKRELEKLKTTMIIEFQALKDLVDFKALIGMYHSIEDKMSLIKDYKENFKETFEKYDTEIFLDLIDIKQINQEPIKEKIQSVNNLKQSINELSLKVKKDLTQDSEKEIQYTHGKIAELHQEMPKKQRVNKKFQENQLQIKQDLIKHIKIFNIVARL